MKVAWGFYTGLMEGGGEVASSAPEVRRAMEGVDDVVGLSGEAMDLLRTPLVSFCKHQVITVTDLANKTKEA
uniref:Uncharacterized protein n=1 Tax=Oryza brachyantha TaxID=4533 RepID=J3NE70_ORYBR